MNFLVPRILPLLLGALPLVGPAWAGQDCDLRAMRWEDRVFLVVADGGPARIPFKDLVEDPTTFFWKRRVGCAVYMGESRYLLTTRSVVGDNSIVEVFNEEGRHVVARIVGADRHLDLALLEAVEDLPRTDELPPLTPAEAPVTGSPCMVLGSAYGQSLSASRGVIAERAMLTSTGLPVQVRRVEVPIYPGDSGGPVLDPDGRFLGILTAVVSRHGEEDAPVLERSGELEMHELRTRPAASSGFVVPAATCLRAWNDFRAHGRVRRGFLGVQMSLEHGGDQIGAEILQVMAGSPADAVGIRPGDRILRFGSHVVTDPQQFRALVVESVPGEPLELLLVRDQMDLTLTVRLAEAIRGRKLMRGTLSNIARPVDAERAESAPSN